MVERKTPSGDPSPEEPAYLARRIDASAMKAFAHPLRMAMYDYLNDHEAATATMLAKHTGESTGQTSYHLRQLERHGFVEEDPTRGSGRERWWKAVGFRMDSADLMEPAVRPAVVTMLQNQVAQRAEALRSWFERSENEPAPWAENTITSRTTAKLTAQEMGDLNRAVMETIHEHTERAKARRTADAAGGDNGQEDESRQVRIYLDTFPLPEDD